MACKKTNITSSKELQNILTKLSKLVSDHGGNAISYDKSGAEIRFWFLETWKTGFMLLANVVKKGRLLLPALRLPCQYPAKMRIAVSPTVTQDIYSDFYTRLCPRNSRIGIVSLTLGVFLLLVGGCRQKGGIEGEYVDVDSPDLSMIIKGGRFQQGGADIHTTGTYTMRQINANTYELGRVICQSQTSGTQVNDHDCS